jgi:cytochrome c biogenesis protein CcmG, thiol:disulfide interchange protein DsbE
VSTAAPSRRRHTARWVTGAVLVVLVVVSVVLATRPSVQATAVQSPLDGHAAPAISARTFSGAHISLASLHGHYVFVNFFASWCPPCAAEEPSLVAFDFEQHKLAGGAALLSVDVDDSTSGGARFVDQWGITWPALPDRAGTIANAYGVGSPPMTFLIDPRGTVVTAYAGPITLSQLQGMLASARRDA